MDRPDFRPAPPVGPSDVAKAPHWLPRPAELDDVELALAGVDLPITVRVPPSVREELGSTPGLVLTDPEGTPLALLRPTTQMTGARPAGTVEPSHDGSSADDSSTPAAPDRHDGWESVTGEVVALQPGEHGPFRDLRRSAAEVRAAGRNPLAVLVDQPMQEAHVTAVAAAAADRPVLLLVLAGEGSSQLVDAVTLVRATLATAATLPAADVVVIPLARGADPAADAARRALVLAAYGDLDEISLDTVDSTEPLDAVRAALDSGSPLAPDTFAAPVEDLLRRAHRRPDERGLTVLFTGLSGSGKSTLARALVETVTERVGRTVTLLDGDVVRRLLSAGLTFSRTDRELNVRRIGFVAAEINRHGGLVVCCPIAPYAATRAEVRAMVEAVGHFVLVHVSTPLAECERRDRKGLYAKARAGLIPEFTGISDPYEAPTDADLTIDTTGVTVPDGVEQVLQLLVRRGYVVPDAPTTRRTER